MLQKLIRKISEAVNIDKKQKEFVLLKSVIMKYSVILLITVALAGPFTTINAFPQTEVITSGTQVGLGTLFFNYIRDCVYNAVKFVGGLLLKIIPRGTPIPVRQIIGKLRQIPRPNVGSLILIAAERLGFEAAPLLGWLPVAITNTRINIRRLTQFFRHVINRPRVPFYVVVQTLRKYFTEQITYDLVTVFNRLHAL